MNAVEKYKKQLRLTQLESDFYYFVCEMLGLMDSKVEHHLELQLRAWFAPEKIDKGDGIFSQYLSEFIQQKYRVLLEFCAKQAGFDHVVGYESLDNEEVLVSYGSLWFQGSPPNAIHWILTDEDNIIYRGKIWPGDLTSDNLEDWLLNYISLLSRVRREYEGYTYRDRTREESTGQEMGRA